jgi:hypothetical protein
VVGFGRYPAEAVTFLVRDLSDVLVEVSTEEFEASIGNVQHYAELLPVEERQPSAAAVALFQRALAGSARRLARAVWGGSRDRARPARSPTGQGRGQ